MDIEIQAEPRRTFRVNLVGVMYDLTAPKSALALRLAIQAKQANTQQDPAVMLTVLDEWLDSAVGPKVAKEIHKRLDDPKDALDVEHLSVLMQKVVEQTSGNPTTSSSD